MIAQNDLRDKMILEAKSTISELPDDPIPKIEPVDLPQERIIIEDLGLEDIYVKREIQDGQERVPDISKNITHVQTVVEIHDIPNQQEKSDNIVVTVSGSLPNNSEGRYTFLEIYQTLFSQISS